MVSVCDELYSLNCPKSQLPTFFACSCYHEIYTKKLDVAGDREGRFPPFFFKCRTIRKLGMETEKVR